MLKLHNSNVIVFHNISEFLLIVSTADCADSTDDDGGCTDKADQVGSIVVSIKNAF